MKNGVILALSLAVGCSEPPPDQRCDIIGHRFEPSHQETRRVPEEKIGFHYDLITGDYEFGSYTEWADRQFVVPDRWFVLVRYVNKDESVGHKWVGVSKDSFEFGKAHPYLQMKDGQIFTDTRLYASDLEEGAR